MPFFVYKKMVLASSKDRIPGKKLVIRLVHHVFSGTELATMNATGKTTGQAPYPRLNVVGLKALFLQAKMQFCDFNEDLTDTSCETIRSLNNICKKNR